MHLFPSILCNYENVSVNQNFFSGIHKITIDFQDFHDGSGGLAIRLTIGFSLEPANVIGPGLLMEKLTLQNNTILLIVKLVSRYIRF